MPPAEPKVLADLLEISQTLGRVPGHPVGPGAGPRAHRAEPRARSSATIALREADGDELAVEAAVGAGWQTARQARYGGGGHHRPRGAERQAGGRARGQPRAAVPEPHGRPEGARQGRAQLHLRAGHGRTAARWARSGVTLPYRKDRRYDQEMTFFVDRGLDDRPGRARAPAGRGRAPAAACRRTRQLRQELKERYDFRNIIGNSRPMQAGLRAGRAGGAHQHHRAHPRRVGHRQGDDRPRHPLQLAARGQAVRQGELRRAARRASSSRSCSATSRAPSPTPARRRRAASSWPTAARCSSTRSAS